MGATSLVGEDVAAGHNVIEALDDAGFPVKAAFWLYNSDADAWKLWIGSPSAGRDLQQAYVRISEILSAVVDKSVLDLSQIKLVRQDDPLVKAIASVIRVKGLSDVRFRSNTVNGIYIPDALIYRTAA